MQLNGIANLDRLPNRNSLAAMHILRSVWDDVDLYTAEATHMKRIAKGSYYLLLLVGAATTTLVTLSLNRPDLMNAEALNFVVIGISMFASFVSALISLFQPVTKWQQLRSAASTLESDAWRFRTRTGTYSLVRDRDRERNEDRPEQHLHTFVTSVREHIVRTAAISRTGFMSRFEMFGAPAKPTRYKHGQYVGAASSGTFGRADPEDDHHSPLKPEEYIAFRVRPMLNMYQKRVPRYSLRRKCVAVLSFLLTSCGTVLAVLDLATWAAVSTAAVGVVMSYAEFNSVDRKLVRYSDTIHSLQHIILWWRAKSAVDRSNLAHISQLVDECEKTFQCERTGWVATSITSKALNKAAKDAAGAADGSQGGKSSGGNKLD